MSNTLGKIIADFQTQLAVEIAVGATTGTLQSATDDDGVALPTGQYYLTVDGDNSQKEYYRCTLTGTAITDIVSISRQGATTVGSVRKHRVGASVTITNFAHLKFVMDLLDGTTGFNSAVNIGYDGAPTGLSGNDFATVAYVLSVVSGGTVFFDTQSLGNQTAGETITTPEVVYYKESDQRWWLADADLTATFDELQLGITLTTATAGNTAQIAISGPVGGFTGLTPGSKYYLSNTAGAISTSAGTNSVFIGWALSSTTILFNTVPATLPTQNEKNALAGSKGTPSSSNLYITEDNLADGVADQSQTTQDTTLAFGEADATTKYNDIAQSFVPGVTGIRGVELFKAADTGSFSGTVTISLQADSSGSPSGTPLATVTLTNATWLKLDPGFKFTALFGSEYTSLTIGDTYWIVIETSTSDNSNHPNIGINSAGGYASGGVKYKNTTDGWNTIATIDFYFKTLTLQNSQIAKLNSTGILNGNLVPLNSRMYRYTNYLSTVTTTTVTITHNLGYIPSMVVGSAFGVNITSGNSVDGITKSDGVAYINSAYAITYSNTNANYYWNTASPADGTNFATATDALLTLGPAATGATGSVKFTIAAVSTTTMDVTMTVTSSGAPHFNYVLDIYV